MARKKKEISLNEQIALQQQAVDAAKSKYVEVDASAKTVYDEAVAAAKATYDSATAKAETKYESSVTKAQASYSKAISKAEKQYHLETDRLNDLIEKRDALRRAKLMDAIGRSEKTYEEVMDFLGVEEADDEDLQVEAAVASLRGETQENDALKQETQEEKAAESAELPSDAPRK